MQHNLNYFQEKIHWIRLENAIHSADNLKKRRYIFLGIISIEDSDSSTLIITHLDVTHY